MFSKASTFRVVKSRDCVVKSERTDSMFYYLLFLFLKYLINSLPNEKILNWTKLKACADDKQDVAKIMISVYDRVENIVGKGENAGDQHFLLFPQCF